MKNCSFTGHRKIPQHHIRPLGSFIDRAIAYAYEKGCRNFYAGGALGFDTMCAKAVIRFRMLYPEVKLILVIPCKNQAERWSESQIETYEYTLSSADEVVYTGEEYTPYCMRVRNEYLADKCDMLIAYVEREHSGSAQTMQMARSLGKTVYNLYPSLEKANNS